MLLKLDKEGKAVLICLDNSYCNTTHSDTHLWHLSTVNPIRNNSTSRGRSLIFVSAIMKDGPLCGFDVIKCRPIEKIKWKVNTPHVNSLDIKTTNKAAAPFPLTSEIIWISNLYTGDYHDNINGKMLINWITTKIIPLAGHNYPGVQMVPVIDNSTYHCVRGEPFQ